MPKTIWIAVNGIRTIPGDEKDWNLRFGVWIDQNAPDDTRCHAVQYFCTAIGRALGQRKRCLKVMNLLGVYQGWNINIVSHSNGCAVALEGLALAGWPRVNEIHLISGACEKDFNKNGLNTALINGRVGKVVVYVSGKDKALKFAAQPLAKLLGYGVLGLKGPTNVNPVLGPGRVSVINDGPWLNYGHSGCWEESQFNDTCEMITNRITIRQTQSPPA